MEAVGEAIRTSTTIDSINVDPINVEPISVLEPISIEPINVVKGKRTKRQRALSPHSTFPMTITSSSSGEGGGIGARGDGYRDDGDHIMRSPTTSFELGESTEEEEDMANCLILLAQGYSPNIAKTVKDGGGGGGDGGRGDAIMEKFNSRRFTEAATTTNGKAGFYVYECKTCNRCFPSFQALGGHRASHKKPKAMNEEKKAFMLLDDDTQFNTNGPNLSLQISSRGMFSTSTNTNKSKVHECSICGSEFSSGQALGGHMRRHRTTTTNINTMSASTMDAIVSESHEPIKKTKSVLSLDLNLPAPEDDRDTKFPFNSKTVLSLIDCHY